MVEKSRPILTGERGKGIPVCDEGKRKRREGRADLDACVNVIAGKGLFATP